MAWRRTAASGVACFRDQASEETDYPREVIEAPLAHVARNRVVAAYARSDLFERRRVLMDDWVRYLALPGPRGGESRVLGVSWSKEAEGIGCSHQVQQGGLARGRPR